MQAHYQSEASPGASVAHSLASSSSTKIVPDERTDYTRRTSSLANSSIAPDEVCDVADRDDDQASYSVLDSYSVHSMHSVHSVHSVYSEHAEHVEHEVHSVHSIQSEKDEHLVDTNPSDKQNPELESTHLTKPPPPDFSSSITGFYRTLEEDEGTDGYVAPAPTSHVAITSHIPQKREEMAILNGDLIGIERQVSEDWCLGQNISQQRKRGLFRLSAVTPILSGPSQAVWRSKFAGT